MQSEMQELIEAADAVIQVLKQGWIPDLSSHRLENAIAAARASEGGWISVQELPPEEANRKEYLTYSPYWGRQVKEFYIKGSYRGFDWDGGCNIPEMDKTTHYRELPSPPLSVETPGKEGK